MTFNLLFAGRPVLQKGLGDLLKALALLGDYDWTLTIVGEIPKEISMSDFIFYERVRLIGAISNDSMPCLLNSHSILVVPSHYENFGNIIIEGLACGIVIIASRTGGIKNLIKHMYNGLSFEPQNYIQLSDRIKFIFEHPQIVEEISKNALLSSIQYDWKNIIAQTLILFEKFI